MHDYLDKKYQYEVSLLDNFFEFHPDWFEGLTEADREALSQYYGFDEQVEDIIRWRDEAVAEDPSVADRARSILARVLKENGGIEQLTYPER